ncbi:MAG TPA: TerC family protein [Candidatus Limnocylindria bacterium]|nr:TerC family protein [Candidatus Limnocylindria bacterium]
MDLSAISAIVLIDLALSGDNALLIGMAARRLPDVQRRRAIVLGGALAVVLRILAAAIVTFLLAIPYLQLTGGVVLAIIAYRLVRPGVAGAHPGVQPAGTLRDAVVTILVADAAMSVENVLGVGGAAHGDLPLLAFGLGISIPIVLFGSGIIASVLDRAPQLSWLGALALIWTSADMILGDPALDPHIADHWGISAAAALGILGAVVAVRALRHRPA